MSTNPLNDISKVYLEQIAAEAFVDPEQGEAPSGRSPLQNVSDHPNASVRKRAVKAFKSQMGKEYGGTWKSRTKDPVAEAAKPDYLDFDGDGNEKESMRKALRDKAKQKMEEAKKPNDGNLANNYPPYDKVTRGDVIAGATGKDQMGGKKKKVTKEGFSNWREDLIEIADKIEVNKSEEPKIVEKEVNNNIKINPNIGEAVENLGGTLLEMVEIDEFDYILESAYDELLEEGYDDDAIEDALEFALTEAKVTFGHDTPTAQKKKEGLLSAARKRLAGAKAAAKQAVATGARKVAKGALGVARKMEAGDKKPQTAARKPSTYRGAGAGQKEKVSSGSYTPPAKKKAEKPSDPWEGSATTPPKAKAKKAAAPKAAAAPKKKRKSKLDALLADVRSESVIGNRARSAVADDRLSSEQEKTSASMDKLRAQTKRHEKSTALARTQARIAAKKSEDTARAMHPKPGVSGYRIEETQIDEKVLTAAETKEKERIVKSMKKKEGYFEKRYPGRGKEVMYATATKMAKKIAEQAMEIQPKSQQSTQQSSAQKKVVQQQSRQRQQEVQILQRKLQALKSAPKGIDTDITA